MADVERLILRLDAEVDKFNANMARAAKATDNSTRRMTKDIRTTEGQIKKFSMNSVRALQIFGAAVGVALSTRELVRYADTWNRVQNRLLLATESGKEAASTLDALTQVAIDSRTDLDATALLYQRIERGTRDLTLSTQELLDVTSTINKAFVINGATAQEASASVIQLSQAFSRGVLRGDEFRSVSEQAPEILRAISAATGKTRGELIKYAEQGALTTEIVIKSLQLHGKVVQEEFAKTQKTISQTVSVVETEFTRFIGKLDESNDVTGTFSDFITSATKDMDDWVPTINTGIDSLLTWIESWKIAFGSDAKDGILDFSKQFERQMMALGSITKVTSQFLTDSFKNMPINIVAAVKIATIELITFMDNVSSIVSFKAAELTAPIQKAAIIAQSKIKSLWIDFQNFINILSDEEARDLSIAVSDSDLARIAKLNETILNGEKLLNEELANNEQARSSVIVGILEEREANLILVQDILAGRAEIRTQAEIDADDEEKRNRKKKKATLTLESDMTSHLKKEEAIRKRLRSQGRRDAITILSALAGDNKRLAQAVFLVDKGLAAAEVFVNTEVAAAGVIKSYAGTGPQGVAIGAALAAKVRAGGQLSIAAILASSISGFSSAGGGGGGGGSVGGSGDSSSPEINTEVPDAVAIDINAASSGGQNNGTIRFVASAGDELGEVMTDWINENIKKGKIG